ncbi:arsenical efflux pump membrane protein ArsB [Deinococcus planocerae]|uniref:arsenical efflux pump membrane protein ArsB n=1 Tax=Deinococcus planocerae TaxID=1737569 RepID=UPI000C7F7270|nr:arsenical efflux pump membrane protein ArsB [Deinococcus planocerae]
MSALLVFLVTVALVVWQPRGLKPAWAALGGAAAALLLGVVRPADVGVVWHATWNATLTLVGLIVMSLLLDGAGFFRWAALHLARWGRGRGLALFVLLIVFTALVSALFANDGAVLILTPVALELAEVLTLDRAATLAFALAVGFVVDATSLPLPVSNLVNIVVADAFHQDFARYARVMVPVDAAALLACLAVLIAVYRRALPTGYDPAALPPPGSAVRSRGLFLAGWTVLPLLLAGYFLADPLGVPLGVVTTLGATALWLVAARSRQVSSRAVLGHAPWDVVAFALGMYLVVYGQRSAGFTAGYGELVAGAAGHGTLPGVLMAGGSVAALSAVMNNLPAVLFALLGVQGAALTPQVREGLAYALIVGADIGPKLTPIGSLATLLWLYLLGRRGVRVSWGDYFRAGIVLTPPVLLAALLALAILVR